MQGCHALQPAMALCRAGPAAAVTVASNSMNTTSARPERQAPWHWEQDASLRFVQVDLASSLSGPLHAAFSGRHWSELPAVNVDEGGWREHLQRLDAHEPFFHLELELSAQADSRLWISLSGVPVFDGGGTFRGYRGVGRDITGERTAEATIASLSLMDQLTGLSNRRLLLERLHSARLASVRSREHGALVFIDIDKFRDLNNTLGHASADRLLVAVGTRLAACMRDCDTVARMAGDVFAVLAPALGSDSERAARNAHTIADKLALALAATGDSGDDTPPFTSSLGVCLFQGAEASVEEVVQRAERALQEAKQQGRRVTRYFDVQTETLANQRAAQEQALSRALPCGELRLFYQPVVNAAQQVIGYEALVRWQHPQQGLLTPGHFIALAEESGLIVPIGEWVLTQACRQLAAFATDPALRERTVAVNLSARQLAQPDLVERIQHILLLSGAPARRLKLEITESMLLTDMGKTSDTLRELTRLGIRFALDDFGTGYSSLSYLKRLPLSQLKIDQSFVRELLTDPVDAAIVRTILQLAKSLGMSVVAEGVEQEGQRRVLADMGCTEFQGYLFGKPQPLE